MTLRNRLVAVLTVLVLALTVAGVAVGVALHRVERHRSLVLDKLEPAGVESRALLVSLVDQETGQRGYVLTGDARFLAPYDRGRRAFPDEVAALRRTFAGDRGILGVVDRVEAAAGAWRRVGAEPEIAARRSGDMSEAERQVTAGRGKAAFDRVRREVDALQARIDARIRGAQRRDAADLAGLASVLSAAAALVAVACGAVLLLLRRWLLVPVRRIREGMRRVAGGELDHRLPADGPPEVAAIGRDAESMRRRIVAELEAAEAATQALQQHGPAVLGLRRELAASTATTAPGLRLAGQVLSAEGLLAGDWWDAVPRPDGTTALVLADVSGHGTEAGLVAFRFKQRLAALLGSDLDVRTAFSTAARHDARSDEDAERFVACLLLVIDPDRRRVVWINAGHPPALLVARNGDRRVVTLEPTGPLVSAVSSGWAVRSEDLGTEDLLVLCTDGVLEARNRDGEQFGEAGVLSVVRGLREWTPAEAVAECLEAVRRFAVDVRRDDVTCVAASLS